MTDKDFLSLLQKHNKKHSGNIPDKELSHQFIDDIFDFLFVPKTGVNQKESDLEKGWFSLKSHLTTLIYDVVSDGSKAQSLSDQFFKKLPDIYETLQKDASFL